MPLTPIDVQQKTFGPELRGYNMDEVDDFLDEVVSTLKDYDQRVRDAQDRIRALETEVASRGEQESAISRALVAAQRQADAVVEEARLEAERIRSAAYDEADRLRDDRDAERMSLTQEIARMRATVADLKRRIVDLAASAGAELDSMDSAIAQASAEIAGPVPAPEDTETYPEDTGAYPEETPLSTEPEGDWSDTAEDFVEEPAPGWEEEVAVDISEEEGGWATDTEEASPADLGPEENGSEEQEEAEGEFGHLADELAGEAAAAPEEPATDTPPPSRRPWERGSV